MRKNYEAILPERYQMIAQIEFSKLQTGFLHDLNTILPGLVIAFVVGAVVKPTLLQVLTSIFISAIFVYPYFVVHEVLHWIVYKALTGQNARIRFNRYGAACSLGEIFLYRNAALYGTAAPFIVCSVLLVLLSMIFASLGSWLSLVTALLLILHLFGCCSDLHLLAVLNKYRASSLLVCDKGDRQLLYYPEDYIRSVWHRQKSV